MSALLPGGEQNGVNVQKERFTTLSFVDIA